MATSMTKKHFIALAAELRQREPIGVFARNDATMSQWRRDCNAIADVCARFNPKFDRARFLVACGVEEAK